MGLEKKKTTAEGMLIMSDALFELLEIQDFAIKVIEAARELGFHNLPVTIMEALDALGYKLADFNKKMDKRSAIFDEITERN